MVQMAAQVPRDAQDLGIQAILAPQDPLGKLRIPAPQDAQEMLPKSQGPQDAQEMRPM